MKTWIKCDYILSRSDETKLLQELVVSKNLDMVKAIEMNTCHRATNFTERRVLNFINFIKGSQDYKIFRVGTLNNYTLNPDVIENFNYARHSHMYTRLLDIKNKENDKTNDLYLEYSIRRSNYPYSINVFFNKNKKFQPLNIFSVGLYRVYKNQIYKAINFYQEDLKKLIKQ